MKRNVIVHLVPLVAVAMLMICSTAEAGRLCHRLRCWFHCYRPCVCCQPCTSQSEMPDATKPTASAGEVGDAGARVQGAKASDEEATKKPQKTSPKVTAPAPATEAAPMPMPVAAPAPSAR